MHAHRVLWTHASPLPAALSSRETLRRCHWVVIGLGENSRGDQKDLTMEGCVHCCEVRDKRPALKSPGLWKGVVVLDRDQVLLRRAVIWTESSMQSSMAGS